MHFKEPIMAKTFAEQIVDLKATRDAKFEEVKAIGQRSVDENRSMDTAEAEQFDTAEAEVKRLDSDIARLTRLAELDKASAKALVVPGQANEPARGGSEPAPLQLKTVEKLEPGIAFARYAMCLTKAKGNHELAARLAEKHFPHTESVVRTLKAQAEGADLASLLHMKATVAAGDTTNATWAAPLVYAQTFMGDFIEYLRPRTLIGQANFRPTPFNVRIGGQTSGGSAAWVGQGKAKPVTKFDFNATVIPFTKIAAIAVITQELARFSDPSAAALVRDSLADTVIARIDADLFDPDLAAVANVSPAGLLNGVAPVAVASNTIDYSDPASVRCAIAALWAPWDTTFLGARPAYYTTPAVARQLSLSREALGTVAFPGMTPMGGTLDGVPVRVSQYLANNGGSGGAPFILVDESEIFLADDGAVTLDATDQASIEMSDTPAGSSNPTVAASSVNLVSMWQTNSVAFRAERFIWWGPRRAGAVQWIDGMPTSC
uniref:Structural protein n=1 Tax=Variovorax sp. HH01 TaxID=1084736 RepID=I3PCQ1_9BURK|nr:structural protein [Variovorax sp. HH01]